jgi:hypothetical protein
MFYKRESIIYVFSLKIDWYLYNKLTRIRFFETGASQRVNDYELFN